MSMGLAHPPASSFNNVPNLAQPGFASAQHGHTPVTQLSQELSTLPWKAGNVIPVSSHNELQGLRDHLWNIVGTVDNTIQSAIQSRAAPHTRPAPAVHITRPDPPPKNGKYRCRVCGTNTKSQPALIRHFGIHEISEYYFRCLCWPDCRAIVFRKDKTHRHAQEKHGRRERLSVEEIRSVQRKKSVPRQCPICGCSVNSWSELSNCIAYHCYVGPNSSTNNNDNDDDDGSEDDEDGPNHQHSLGPGRGMQFGSLMGDANAFNSQVPQYQSAYSGVDPGQNYNTMDLSYPGQQQSTVCYAQRHNMDGTGDARTTIQSGTNDFATGGNPTATAVGPPENSQSSVSTQRAPTTVGVAGSRRKLKASLPGSVRAISRQHAQSRRQPKKGAGKRREISIRCKSCGHSAEGCAQCSSQQNINQCHVCVERFAQLPQTRPSYLQPYDQPHGQAQGFGQGVPEASMSSVSGLLTQLPLPDADNNLEVHGSGGAADGQFVTTPFGTDEVFSNQTSGAADQTLPDLVSFPVLVNPTTPALPELGPTISKLPTDDLYGSSLKSIGISDTKEISDLLHKLQASMIISDCQKDEPLSGMRPSVVSHLNYSYLRILGKNHAGPRPASKPELPNAMVVATEGSKEQYTAYGCVVLGMALLAAASASQMRKQPEGPGANGKSHSLRRKAQAIAKLLKLRATVQGPQNQAKAIDKPAFSTSELRMLRSHEVSPAKMALCLDWLLAQLLRAFLADLFIFGGSASSYLHTTIDFNPNNMDEGQSMMFLTCIAIFLLGGPAHRSGGFLLE